MPLVSTTPYGAYIYNPPYPGGGAYFNGTNATGQVITNQVVSSGKSNGYMATWIQLNASGSAFHLGGVGTNQRVQWFVSGTYVRYGFWRDGYINRLYQKTLNTTQGDLLKSELVHIAANKLNNGLGVWFNGAYIGGMSQIFSQTVSDTDPVPDKVQIGFLQILGQPGITYYEGTLKNLVFSRYGTMSNGLASSMYNNGPQGDLDGLIGGGERFYPFSGNGTNVNGSFYHFSMSNVTYLT